LWSKSTAKFAMAPAPTAAAALATTTAAAAAPGRAASRSATFQAGRKAAAKALREEIGPVVGLLSIGDGAMDGVSPDILTHASIMDGSVKYKTLKKLMLQVLCGNLPDHIKDLEEELKEAKVKKAKVELELEEDVFFVGFGTGATTSGGDLELKEAVPTGKDDDGSTTSNGEAGEGDVMGPAVTGGQGQGQAEAEEGLPGEPLGGGLHGRQLWEQTPPGLPRGRPRQGEDPQVHVRVVAHEDPEGKPHREQHQQQQHPTGQAGRQVHCQA
jgi:hypothetical protein